VTDVYLTKKKIPFDIALYGLIRLMEKRCTQHKPKWDNVLNIEGGEGIGKTTLAITVGYIVGEDTNRKFSESNVFTDIDSGVKFAQSTKEQIIIFDEPSSDALSIEFRNKIQINLIKLLMQVRKRRHFIIFNLTKFYKFAEYIVVDRPVGMIHLYANENNRPCWVYIPGKYLEALYNDYKFKKQRNYKKYMTIHGYFVDILDPELPYNILDEFNLEQYEKNKDLGIEMIGKKKKEELELTEAKKIKAKIGKLKPSKKNPIDSVEKLCQMLGITTPTYYEWLKESKNNEVDDENSKV
jgi:hypothetical protein